MKKNLFKKWVSVLGAMLLLANVLLPWLQVHATDTTSLQVVNVEKLEIPTFEEGEPYSGQMETNINAIDVSYANNIVTILDRWLTSYNNSHADGNWFVLVVTLNQKSSPFVD